MQEQDKEYLEKAAKLQKSAEAVMAELEIRERWGKVGKII